MPAGQVVVPIGLIAVAAVPVMWDFATSGLEMGLVWLWIACCWLVAGPRRPRDARPGPRSRVGGRSWCSVSARSCAPSSG